MDADLSGECSKLANVWDEICVQQQAEHSSYWHVYQQTIRVLVEGTIDDLGPAERLQLWLLTPEGKSWRDDNDDDDQPRANRRDIANHLHDSLLSAAADYSNQRIRTYLFNRYG